MCHVERKVNGTTTCARDGQEWEGVARDQWGVEGGGRGGEGESERETD